MDTARRFKLRGVSMPDLKPPPDAGGVPKFRTGDIVQVRISHSMLAFVVDSSTEYRDGTFVYLCHRDGEAATFPEGRLKLYNREGQYRVGQKVGHRGYHCRVCRVTIGHDGELLYDVSNKNKDGSTTNTVNLPHASLYPVSEGES